VSAVPLSFSAFTIPHFWYSAQGDYTLIAVLDQHEPDDLEQTAGASALFMNLRNAV